MILADKIIGLRKKNGWSEELACGVGLVSMFPIVAIAVTIFIRVGFTNAPYEFIEKEPFETEYGVVGLVKDAQKKYRSTYVKYNYIGSCICVLSPVPLLCKIKETVGVVYWLLVTAIFLLWSFLGNDGTGVNGNDWVSWKVSWIVWPVAGVLFVAVMMLCNLIVNREQIQ